MHVIIKLDKIVVINGFNGSKTALFIFINEP